MRVGEGDWMTDDVDVVGELPLVDIQEARIRTRGMMNRVFILRL